MSWVRVGSLEAREVWMDQQPDGLISGIRYFNPTSEDVYLEFVPNDGSPHYIARLDAGADPEVTVSIPSAEQPQSNNVSIWMYTRSPTVEPVTTFTS